MALTATTGRTPQKHLSTQWHQPLSCQVNSTGTDSSWHCYSGSTMMSGFSRHLAPDHPGLRLNGPTPVAIALGKLLTPGSKRPQRYTRSWRVFHNIASTSRASGRRLALSGNSGTCRTPPWPRCCRRRICTPHDWRRGGAGSSEYARSGGPGSGLWISSRLSKGP